MTVSTKIKPMTFEKVTKLMKPFAAGKKTFREVLRMIHFDGEWLITTDSHVLVRIHKDYILDLPSQEPFLYDVHYNMMSEISLNYPNTSRMFPEHFQTEATYNIKDLLVHVKELKQVATVKNKPISMDINTNKTILAAYNAEEQTNIDTREIKHIIKGKEMKIYFNGHNLQNVLTKIKPLLNDSNVTFKLVGGMSPMRISETGVFDVLMSPIRIY